VSAATPAAATTHCTELGSNGHQIISAGITQHHAPTPEEWLALHDYMRHRAQEEDPGEPAIDDEVRQRHMLIDCLRGAPCPRLVNDQIVGSLAMWTRRPGTPDYEAHARLITADAGVRKCARRQGILPRL
jgi:hypothetical protein